VTNKFSFLCLLILACEPSNAQSFDSLAAVRIEDKWGYINPHGILVIDPKYSDAEPFSEGLASVTFTFHIYRSREDWEAWNKMFPTDTNTGLGRLFAHITYDMMKKRLAADTVMAIALSLPIEKRGYIDRVGKVVFWTDYLSYGSMFREGLAPLRQGGMNMDYMNKEGTVVIQTAFDYADSHFEGLACVSNSYGKAGYIDTSGALVIDTVYDSQGRFGEGLAPVLIHGMWGYIDRKGKTVIQPQFREASSFSEGVAAAKTGEKYGFIDKVGRFVVQPQFDEAKSFHEGLAAVKEGGRWNYIDKRATKIILTSYDDCNDFSQGLAAVASDDKWGYIDTTGKLVIRLQYDKALTFSRVTRESNLER